MLMIVGRFFCLTDLSSDLCVGWFFSYFSLLVISFAEKIPRGGGDWVKKKNCSCTVDGSEIPRPTTWDVFETL